MRPLALALVALLALVPVARAATFGTGGPVVTCQHAGTPPCGDVRHDCPQGCTFTSNGISFYANATGGPVCGAGDAACLAGAGTFCASVGESAGNATLGAGATARACVVRGPVGAAVSTLAEGHATLKI